MADVIWWDSAACANSQTEVFFPAGTSVLARRDVAAAKEVCGGCGVRRECLDWALNMSVAGIWGGLSEHERRRVRRERAANAEPATV